MKKCPVADCAAVIPSSHELCNMHLRLVAAGADMAVSEITDRLAKEAAFQQWCASHGLPDPHDE